MNRFIKLGLDNLAETIRNEPTFKLDSKKVGKNSPVFIVAEIGINYDGDWKKAIKMIDVAAAAGCSAVKFQTFRSKHMYPPNAGKLKVSNGKFVAINDLIRKAELPYEWLSKLKRYAAKKGLVFYTSVCDVWSADALEKAKVAAYKITSYEITHLPLIKHCARKGKPLIMSCGGATMPEVVEAVQTARAAGAKDIVLMHCVTSYPAPLDELNLSIIKTLQYQFPDIVIGFSDHSSEPTIAPVAAVTLGAGMIEKHITLDRKSPGPDHRFAVEPEELKEMVRLIRQTESKLQRGEKIAIPLSILGSSAKRTLPADEYVRNFAYTAIYTTAKVKVGNHFNKTNIEVLRSGKHKKGLHSRYYEKILGKSTTKNLPIGHPVQWEDIAR